MRQRRKESNHSCALAHGKQMSTGPKKATGHKESSNFSKQNGFSVLQIVFSYLSAWVFLNRLLVFNTLGENGSAQTHTHKHGEGDGKTSLCQVLGADILCPRTSWSFFLQYRIKPLFLRGSWLTFESKNALYISCEATLGLLLHLVLQRWESNMVEGQVKEQGLAWDGLEAWREVHEADLLADQRRIQTEGLKPFREWLEDSKAETQIRYL